MGIFPFQFSILYQVPEALDKGAVSGSEIQTSAGRLPTTVFNF
jgi:hypothetical protein